MHPNQLTKKEMQILKMIGVGKTPHEIANKLTITHTTVRCHLTTIYQKLGVHDRTNACLYALKSGIVSLDDLEPLELWF
jgi:DNA-binding NarL/FixJ family response regulator